MLALPLIPSHKLSVHLMHTAVGLPCSEGMHCEVPWLSTRRSNATLGVQSLPHPSLCMCVYVCLNGIYPLKDGCEVERIQLDLDFKF